MYRIEEVAQKTHMTKRALRYYEELGLVSPSGRTDSGYRMYTDADVEQILHVKDIRDLLGASLAEIKDMMELSRFYDEQRDYYNLHYKDREPHGVELLKRIETLKTLEETLTSQRTFLQNKMSRMAELLKSYDEKLDRIVNKKNELEAKHQGGNN
ncbi:MerR family transcriptional regulator [Brevibacillus reuszeri]|uniref:MerR family transcriptional regulator n=1 Tax=Brevibacillus reuszeri TaxID=54915 RepID=A0ABQ0TJM7_9BACL|nr:MerR family transcriptional regulator [Brevibacillus reuszeri]MED1856210.1 MerR family transcriptional regulator [Brevibacillus reuszeri]GED68101.1 MerR family transcriptional regulator [Brevibacillus reuszeri]